jgi:dihydrofolate reductase
MRISLIVAHSQNRVIGVQNRLPWNLPEDLRRFKTITMGHPIIMGRKTFDSIGRVLPHRENLIISRQPGYEVSGAVVFSGLDAALAYSQGKTDEAFVIGGGEIYALALPKANRIYLTLVHQEYAGDAFFPNYEAYGFTEISREERPAGPDHPAYAFAVLEKTTGAALSPQP